MHQQPTYVIENGLYAFYLKGQRMFETTKVAILFDRENGVLLKHGKPETVQATLDTYKTRLTGVEGGFEILDALTMLEGAFEVDELNKVVNITGYVAHLFAQISPSNQHIH